MKNPGRSGIFATANWCPIRTPGAAGNHGARLPFQVTIRDTAHPICERSAARMDACGR